MKQWMCDGGWEWWVGGRWIRRDRYRNLGNSYTLNSVLTRIISSVFKYNQDTSNDMLTQLRRQRHTRPVPDPWLYRICCVVLILDFGSYAAWSGNRTWSYYRPIALQDNGPYAIIKMIVQRHCWLIAVHYRKPVKTWFARRPQSTVQSTKSPPSQTLHGSPAPLSHGGSHWKTDWLNKRLKVWGGVFSGLFIGLPRMVLVTQLMRDLATLSQEPLVSHTRLEEPRWAWVNWFMEYDTFPFCALTLLDLTGASPVW